MISPRGLGWGLVGVTAFSFTVPLTRVAVAGLDPFVVGCGRAVVAALLAVIALAVGRARLPIAREWPRLALVAAGVVVGFPVLTSLAMRDTGSPHAAVVIGLLPAATAVGAVLLARERPSSRFWCGAVIGAVVTVGFVLLVAGSPSGVSVSDLYLLGAVVLAALGYAQGGVLARTLGSWQTISWALVLASPVMAAVTGIRLDGSLPHATGGQWAAFGYLCAVSMFLGFFAWYRGLAIGPLSTVGQVQLVQPVLTVAWSVLFFGETIGAMVIMGGVAVVATTAFTVRSRVGTRASRPSRPLPDAQVGSPARPR
ncbi:hypothetical protein GS4_11_02030 [Gordonia soli NBRC 108243]|uniref:EamA domain-containing protein n=1 Tax=Gordonia soli NBRC 108243 TaxID=1223545 RepID=M0QHM4_9ACTN|nr:hypothetical protein GS4_11_02030 [Gordonia soli NBRC 108243]